MACRGRSALALLRRTIEGFGAAARLLCGQDRPRRAPDPGRDDELGDLVLEARGIGVSLARLLTWEPATHLTNEYYPQ